MLKAVIFDMDGVIIDSEPMHARAALMALNKYNTEITLDYIEKFIGSTTYYMCQKMIEDFHIEATPDELLRANNEMKKALLKAEGHTEVPYVIDLIKDLHRNGIKLSIASSSSVAEIEEVMDSLNIRNYFDCFVSGTSVLHTKPAPDIFLEAMKRLNVSPSECFIIEDSFHGVTAACAAGITCIGYVNPHSGNQDLSQAALLLEGFDEVDYKYLSDFYNEINLSNDIITTDLFVIRELKEADIPELFQIYRQPGIRKYLDDFTDNMTTEIQKHKAYMQNVYRYYGYGSWGVFLKDNNKLIGRCGIELKMLNNKSVYEINYLLSEDYQGHGYAQAFVKAVINHSFTMPEVNNIVAVIDKANDRSIHLAKRVDMNYTGECFHNNRNCYIYEICKK